MKKIVTNSESGFYQNFNIKFYAKILIAVALLYFLITYIHFDEIIAAFQHSDKELILFVFFLSFLNIYLQFVKWKVVCNSLLNINDEKKIWLSLFYGFSGGIATPVRVGEYVGRTLPFENVNIVKITIATFLEKFASLFLVLIFGGLASILFIDKYFEIVYSIPFIIFVVGLILIIIALVQGYNLVGNTIAYLSQRFLFFKKLVEELSYVKELGSVALRKLLLYSFLFYSVYILQYALLVKAFNQGGDLLYFIWAGTIVMFAKSFLSFISFADLGIRESASVFILSKMGFAKAIGFNAAIFLFLFNLLIPAILGLFLLFQKDKT